jgi:oxygen-independent coproporphyrinogen-3 oxidase
MVEEEMLSHREAAHEALVMGLRLAEGINTDELARRLGIDSIVDPSAVERLEKLGLLSQRGTRLTITPAGRLLLDSILGEIAV